MNDSKAGKTAYPAAERELREQVRRARVDFSAMAIPLRQCDLSSCRATCCHDGVILGPDEMSIMERMMEKSGDVLRSYEWNPPHVFTRRKGRWKSLSLTAEPGQLAATYPKHFPKTRCVFLDEQHRCVWQRLAIDSGEEPWFWKPISCWMHPLRVRREEDGGFVLTLNRNEGPGFESDTPCGGASGGCGLPAWKVLSEELRWLGEIGGRDLLGEIEASLGSASEAALPVDIVEN
ncbi:MAG: DUF3109 family protein [Verrucomicrobiota bacterium]